MNTKINFKNFKFGSDYYKNKNINFDLIFNSVKNICIGENPKNILDVGCGNGAYFKLFENANYTGVDINDEILKFAKNNGLNVLKCDIEEGLPFKDKMFDGVLTMDVIEHTYDTVFHLKEINRVLKEDGFVILITPNISSLSSRIAVLKGKRPLEVDAIRLGLEGQDHISAFGIEDIYKIFDLTGFNIEKISGINAGRFTGKYLQYFVNKGYLVSLSSSFLVKGKKKKIDGLGEEK